MHLVGFYYRNEILTLGELLLPLSSFVVSNFVGDKTQYMISKTLVSLLMARCDVSCSSALLPHNVKFLDFKLSPCSNCNFLSFG